MFITKISRSLNTKQIVHFLNSWHQLQVWRECWFLPLFCQYPAPSLFPHLFPHHNKQPLLARSSEKFEAEIWILREAFEFQFDVPFPITQIKLRFFQLTKIVNNTNRFNRLLMSTDYESSNIRKSCLQIIKIDVTGEKVTTLDATEDMAIFVGLFFVFGANLQGIVNYFDIDLVRLEISQEKSHLSIKSQIILVCNIQNGFAIYTWYLSLSLTTSLTASTAEMLCRKPCDRRAWIGDVSAQRVTRSGWKYPQRSLHGHGLPWQQKSEKGS